MRLAWIVLAFGLLLVAGGWWLSRPAALVPGLEGAAPAEGPVLAGNSEPDESTRMQPRAEGASAERTAAGPQWVDLWVPSASIPPAQQERGRVIVQVLDGDDRPIPGYPVILQAQGHQGWSPLGGASVGRRVTGDRGWARFDLAALQAETRTGEDWQAVAGLAWHLDAVTSIPREQADRQVWTLRIPSAGVLCVELESEPGTPFPSEAYVYVAWGRSRRNALQDGNGRYWMQDLPLGTELTLGIRHDEEAWRTLDTPVRINPRSPLAHRVVSLAEIQPVLVGELRLPDGAPLRHARFWWRVGKQRSAQLETDALGRFEVMAAGKLRLGSAGGFDASRAHRDGSAQSWLEATTRLGQVDYRLPMELPLVESGETVDVGTLVLSLAPCLAAGQLRRQDGQPVGRMRVAAMRADPEAQGEWLSSTGSEPSGVFVLPGTVDATEVLLTVQPDHWVRTPIDVGQPMVAQGPWCLPEPTAVPVGRRDLDLVLVPAMSMRFSVPGAAKRSIAARFTYVSGLERRIDLGLDDEFAAWMAPGQGRLDLYEADQPNPVLSVPGLRLESGGETPSALRDLRLPGEAPASMEPGVNPR